ncbi:22482_t:CDS:2 [Gigaspora margarita]|uniref:Uncharacterized protein n=2 Tax=Gigaspora margarita TaxID=4874 RepID=A0A8H4B447_GIGMA|nr:hypothetical protein F8M41_010606 [Gigaspora margarita]CAG8732643.1 22482_t:CDS:2 [Gigaspora margarita]
MTKYEDEIHHQQTTIPQDDKTNNCRRMQATLANDEMPIETPHVDINGGTNNDDQEAQLTINGDTNIER